MDNEMKAAYDARHKQAFRVAFDALNEVFPPENTSQYFENAGEHIKGIYNTHVDNPLCRELLIAVYNYLGKEVKVIDKS